MDLEYFIDMGGGGVWEKCFVWGILGLFLIILLCGLNKFEFFMGVWIFRFFLIFVRFFYYFLKIDNEVFKLVEWLINYYLSVNLFLKIFNNYVF